MFDVTRYGASGDGVHDDTQVIQIISVPHMFEKYYYVCVSIHKISLTFIL